MAKKKEDTEVVVTETEKPVYISQELLRQIDSIESEVKIKSVEAELGRLRVDKADKELSLLSANYTLKSKEKIELTEKALELERTVTTKKNQYKELIKEIAKTYGLPDKFGYDHITGEVK